ncbi:MAG: S8 family peptidase [Ignavibacterium sp.]|nr:MAG: S8 family peptidase [Ignavibacterium sp.]
MKSIIVLFVGILTLSLFAQSNLTRTTPLLNEIMYSSTGDEELLVWIFFTDKGENISHYFANPQSVVSEKSLKRRRKVLPEAKLISEMDLPVNEEYIDEIVNRGLRVKQRSRWFNGVSGFATKSEIVSISQLVYVKKLDLVRKFKKDYSLEEENSDHSQLKIEKQSGINSLDYGTSFTQVNQINVPAVHDMGYTGQGVLICSMDSGFDNLAHEVFSSMNIVAMWDFVDNDPDVSRGGSHGTSTLSTIGGFKEGTLIGAAFGSDYLLARTEDIYSETPIEEDNWIAALEWADNFGVDVTTTSLSYLDMDVGFPGYTWQDMDGNTARITIAADLAVGLGIVVVNSASNSGYNSDHNTLGAPADGDSVIAVGAVTSSGQRSSFSSVGPTVDGRIKPDLMAMGSYVFVARSTSPTSYGFSNGTSFSCPLLAGSIALMLSAHPNLTPMEILDMFRRTASMSNNPDNLMGWGIINTLDAITFIPVPVELTSFSGKYIDGEVRLNWTTATESNNSGFEVEKRYEETLFETIGFVAGSGSSTVATRYSFIDDNIIDNKIFYRLKQIDLNEEFIHFDEIMVEIPVVSDFQLFQNYPNPFNPGTTINYSVPKSSEIKIVLYDIIGNEIEKLYEGIQQEGIHQIDFNGSNLSSGVYFVVMTADNFSKSIKISLLK